MSKLVSDLFDIAEFAHHGPENLFISVIKIIGSFIFLFLINWKLAIPLLFLVFCMFAFSMSQNRRMQSTFMENRKKIGDVNSRLQDTLAGIRVVQSFANEDVEKEKFRKSNHNFLLSKDANYKCMGSFMGYNLFFQGMMYLVTLVFGGYLIAKGEMQATDLAMYALYIGIFISPIQILVELTEMIQKGFSGFKRFLAVMETEPEIQNSPDAKPSKTSADWFPSRMYHSTTVMTIPWYYPTFPSRFRQENPLPLPVRQEAEKLQSAPFCQDFMM